MRANVNALKRGSVGFAVAHMPAMQLRRLPRLLGRRAGQGVNAAIAWGMLSALFIGERIGVVQWLGIVVLLVGLGLIQLAQTF